MVSRLCITLVLVCLVTPVVAQDQEAPPVAVAGCAELVAQGELEAALAPCRAELAANPASSDLTRMLALAEFTEGDAHRAAELWGSLLEERWTYEDAHDRAMALWRAGEIEAAEALIRDNLERAPRPEAHKDLIGFLMGFERWQEASEAAAVASKSFADDCDFAELQGIASASLGDDGAAAALIKKALELGCPPYRWTTRGAIPGKIDQPAYLALLDPDAMTESLRDLDDKDCIARLALLRPVFTKKQAPAVTHELLSRTNAKVRLACLGMLTDLGAEVLESWQKLLASDDFILRKYALRRIRELHDPAFIPLLTEHLEREKLPGNLSLTRLTLGEILLDSDTPQKGRELLLAIPENDALHPVALLELADHAEAEGDLAAALQLIEKAQEADPQIHVDPDRLEKLRGATGQDEKPEE